VISVVVLFRNAPRLAQSCLDSLIAVGDALGEADFWLFDDHSDADRAVMPALQSFRARVPRTNIVRFHRQMHYAHGLGYALSLAKGEQVLFISHDMAITRDCVAALRDAAASDPRIGVIRPTSQHMDWARAFVQSPAGEDITTFSAKIRHQFARDIVDWPMLIGDAMLIRRAVIESIGVFDPRYYGFMADIDYGVRLHRAGFRHAIARGAWLHHEGGGTSKATATDTQTFQQQGHEMLKLVEAAYDQFRRKWGEANLPLTFREMRRHHFDHLNATPSDPAVDYQPPLVLSPADGEIL
jgi:GT2 family glycosyltransferase